MTATIEHRPSKNMSPVPAAFFTFAVIAVIAVIGVIGVIALVGVAAQRSSDASSHNLEVPAAPAAYVASAADLFEQRVAARGSATYVASAADLFERRVAGCTSWSVSHGCAEPSNHPPTGRRDNGIYGRGVHWAYGLPRPWSAQGL